MSLFWMYITLTAIVSLVFAGSFATSTNAVTEVNNVPIIISEVELWGPVLEVGRYRACDGGHVFGSIQWLELYNPTNKIVKTADGYNITNTKGYRIDSIADLELKPHEICLYELDSIRPQVGPWIPLGTEDASFIFEYHLKENGNVMRYEFRTPELTDQYNDTRTWQLEGNEWVFKEMSPPEIEFITVTGTTADGSIIVELTRPNKFEVPTSARFDLRFIDARTGKPLDYVKYNFYYTDGDRKFGTFAGVIDFFPSYDNIAINGTSTQYAEFTEEAQNTLTIEITSLDPSHSFKEPKVVEFTNVVVPEFPVAVSIASGAIGVTIAMMRMKSKMK